MTIPTGPAQSPRADRRRGGKAQSALPVDPVEVFYQSRQQIGGVTVTFSVGRIRKDEPA